MNLLTYCLHDDFSESSSCKSHSHAGNEVRCLEAEARHIQTSTMNMTVEKLS